MGCTKDNVQSYMLIDHQVCVALDCISKGSMVCGCTDVVWLLSG